MAQKPSIPKGTRDFGQREMAERNYIFDTIRSVFRTYGYQQIETPAMENLSTLLGKYGDEGDKLLFRIQNSGEKAELPPEKGLRYDLTVPFARYVVQHQNEISFPFKRYQIQPGWRADRPQKGRYREFYQCDVDVIGSTSQVNELELVEMVDRVFTLLGIRVGIKINNRKVLTGLAEICGFPERVVDITVAIDKLDKIGLESVEAEMLEKGLTADAVAVLRPVLLLSGTTEEKLATMRGLFNGGSASGLISITGLKGLDELEELFGFIGTAGVSQPVEIDLSLARGLNYYTGAIFEVKALDFPIGSICGGGRYDNLTGIFGLPNVSGVGISFGADRIYDVLKGLEKGLTADAVAVLRPVLLLSGTTEEKLATMRGLFNGGSASGLVSATGLKGLDELEELFGFIGTAGVSQPVEIDLSLARGLNYYTGAIFEVKALDFPIGSICGGGRYDNLTGIFGLPNVSGVGISFGADRIYDVLKGLEKFPKDLGSSTRLLFAVMGTEELQYVLPLAKTLREAGVSVEVYPEPGKLKKQFDYAAKKAIPFISINGSSEIEAATVNLKNLETGEQQAFPAADMDKILEFLN